MLPHAPYPRKRKSKNTKPGRASPHNYDLAIILCAAPHKKKNWLFFGSEEAGQRSAVLYTLIENCPRHGVEPYTYLKDVLERLPSTTNQQVGQLTPLHWKKGRQVEVKLAA